MNIEEIKAGLFKVPRMIDKIKKLPVNVSPNNEGMVVLTEVQRDWIITELEKRTREVEGLCQEVKDLGLIIKASRQIETFGGD